MASRKNSRSQLSTLPGRQWLTRISLIFLICAGVTLLGMSRSQNPAAERLRESVLDLITPVLKTAASPVEAVRDAGSWLSDMSRLREENIALKNQNLELMKWQSAAKNMEAENRALRSMLSVVPSKGNTYITARIVSDIGGPYARAALVDGGSDSGIKKDEAVVNQDGLVGRVVESASHSARILLIDDVNSHIPVMTEKSREKAILTGNHDESPTLSFVSAKSAIEPGARIVTSGDGGIFPVGIPVGIVTSVKKGAITVQPFIDESRLEYVNIIDYSIKKP